MEIIPSEAKIIPYEAKTISSESKNISRSGIPLPRDNSLLAVIGAVVQILQPYGCAERMPSFHRLRYQVPVL